MLRLPWVVYDVLKLEEAVSPNVTSGMLLLSLIGYVVVYGGLMAATIYLLRKYAVAGPDGEDESPPEAEPSLISGQD